MLKKIVASLKDRTALPVQVEEVAQAIISAGVQDTIYFKGVDGEDPGQIHGAFWRYVRRPNLYGDPEYIAIIPYNTADSIQWQRVTCCKEMVHLFDSDLERTDKKDEVTALLDRLLGRMSSDDVGLADLMAGKDRLALYYCLPLLFPKAALICAREDVSKGIRTVEEISHQVGMPRGLVLVMLNPEWDTLNGQLEAIC